MKNLGNQFKIWIFPSLIGVLSWFLVNSINSFQKQMDDFNTKIDAVNNNVNIILVQTSVNKSEIDNIKEKIKEPKYSNIIGTSIPVKHPSKKPIEKEKYSITLINDSRTLKRIKKS